MKRKPSRTTYLIDCHSKRPHVTRARLSSTLREDLRALEADCPQALQAHGRGTVFGFSQPEVAKKGIFVVRNEDVGSLDISMNDAALV